MTQGADGQSPMVELAVAAYFQPWLALSTVQLGLVGQRLQRRFPVVTEHALAPPLVETLPGGTVAPARDFPLFPPRLWFTSEDGGSLVQLQFDRIVYNWRRQGAEYPGYAAVLERFWAELAELFASLRDQGIEPPCVETCEITYVNHVLAGDGWDEHGQIDRLFTFVGALEAVPPVEEADLRLTFVIPDDAGQPVGRLHFRAQAAARATDRAKLYAVTLTARTRPATPSDNNVRSAFDAGHTFARRAFDTLMTPHMHAEWSRARG